MCEVHMYIRCPEKTKYQFRDKEILADFVYKLSIIG